MKQTTGLHVVPRFIPQETVPLNGMLKDYVMDEGQSWDDSGGTTTRLRAVRLNSHGSIISRGKTLFSSP